MNFDHVLVPLYKVGTHEPRLTFSGTFNGVDEVRFDLPIFHQLRWHIDLRQGLAIRCIVNFTAEKGVTDGALGAKACKLVDG